MFGVVVTPVVALSATRDGHGSEEAADAQRELWLLNRDVEPEDPKQIGSSYFMFGMFENPKFKPDAGEPPPRGACAALATRMARRDRPDERSVDELVALAVGAGRTRFAGLRLSATGRRSPISRSACRSTARSSRAIRRAEKPEPALPEGSSHRCLE